LRAYERIGNMGRMRFAAKITLLVAIGLAGIVTANSFRSCVEWRAYMRAGEEDTIRRNEDLKKWRASRGLDEHLKPVTRPTVLDEP
jgi:hypothetical protein